MSYLVLARKFRPQTFSDLVGQEHVTQTLRNAIAQGRIAHAFLFTGVGKTTIARGNDVDVNEEATRAARRFRRSRSTTPRAPGSRGRVAQVLDNDP